LNKEAPFTELLYADTALWVKAQKEKVFVLKKISKKIIGVINVPKNVSMRIVFLKEAFLTVIPAWTRATWSN